MKEHRALGKDWGWPCSMVDCASRLSKRGVCGVDAGDCACCLSTMVERTETAQWILTRPAVGVCNFSYIPFRMLMVC